MEAVNTNVISPDRVQAILAEYMPTAMSKLPMVLDLENSQGVHLHDLRTDRVLLDFFGFYASSAVGMNHPKMTGDEAFMERLVEAALNKVTNSDVLTPHMARFVETFSRVALPETFRYMFFISGGALAIENALKAAFDWKVRRNFEKGYRREVGHKVLHLEDAFHGRTGYTMSLTNTAAPIKTQYFAKFDWPRITNPKVVFPLEDHLEDVRAHEERALQQARRHFYENEDEIAAIIVEPVQSEGGDNHFRPAFLQALKNLALENEALLIFDEVQSGVGLTGTFWAFEGLDVEPDIVAFGKKSQVCGIIANDRLDEVEEHVFKVPSRINSTWGGNIVDMVRFDRILEIIEEDDLVSQAADVGAHLQKRLHELAEESTLVDQVRGRGLMCAFDMPTPALRDRVLRRAYEEGLIVIGCGARTVRFRSPLIITREQIDEGMELLTNAVRAVEQEG